MPGPDPPEHEVHRADGFHEVLVPHASAVMRVQAERQSRVDERERNTRSSEASADGPSSASGDELRRRAERRRADRRPGLVQETWLGRQKTGGAMSPKRRGDGKASQDG